MPKSGQVTKGENYDKLLAEFLEAGGDLSKCPFDTEEYKFEPPDSSKKSALAQ